MSALSKMARIRGIGRISKITRVLIRHGLGNVAERMMGRTKTGRKTRRSVPADTKSGYPSAQRLRLALEELGPSFIKLGQLMSIRADVLPAEYIEELKKLQDQVEPLPLNVIRPQIEKELKMTIDEAYYTFSQEAMAAASVAQVHKAELFTGETVAVKIIRPGIVKTIQDDIRLMYYFAEKIEKAFEFGRMIGAMNIVKEFERTIFRELDMLTEAGNIERFTANFDDVDEIRIPKVYWEFTTKSILTMDFISGVKMDEVEKIRALDIDPKEIAMIGLRSFSRQLMEFGFFHADPHPANTIVTESGQVALVDFGITGYLDEEAMRQIAYLFLGFAEHDYTMVIDALQDAGILDEDRMDLMNFRADLKDISEPFYGRSLQTISVKDVYEQIMQLIYKYKLHLPRNILLLLKTFIQTEALGKILGSDAGLLEVTRPYAQKLLKQGYEAQKIYRSIGSEARSFGLRMKTFPKLVHDILKRTAGGRHRVEIRHGGFENVEKKFEKGINRLIVGIIISASTIAGALILNTSNHVMKADMKLWIFESISLPGLLGLTGYTIATILGIWLIISIFRSGRM
ncbi:MAG: AarF/ABC1/UbiB kinase family protein [Desulfobacteraceae bacterium]|nr:AarF/ABC1/UbiB kinase family protein [Desulfobacteraceae bacterium]